MTAPLFLVFLAAMTATVVGLGDRYLGRRTAVTILVGLSCGSTYAGLMAYFGVIRNAAMRPPGIAFILVPVILFLVVFIVRSSARMPIAVAVPIWIILGLQSFRMVVELFLHQLWLEESVPKMLTFRRCERRHLCWRVGAPDWLVVYARARRFKGRPRVERAGSVVAGQCRYSGRVDGSGPLDRLHAEVPNLIIGTFPFVFIPAFFVPLAVVLHILAIQAIWNRLR